MLSSNKKWMMGMKVSILKLFGWKESMGDGNEEREWKWKFICFCSYSQGGGGNENFIVISPVLICFFVLLFISTRPQSGISSLMSLILFPAELLQHLEEIWRGPWQVRIPCQLFFSIIEYRKSSMPGGWVSFSFLHLFLALRRKSHIRQPSFFCFKCNFDGGKSVRNFMVHKKREIIR
jgi:hypothetical protein